MVEGVDESDAPGGRSSTKSQGRAVTARGLVHTGGRRAVRSTDFQQKKHVMPDKTWFVGLLCVLGLVAMSCSGDDSPSMDEENTLGAQNPDRTEGDAR